MLIHVQSIQVYREHKIKGSTRVNIRLHPGHFLSTNTHMFTLTPLYVSMINCEHCDVEAYYRITVEDFNSVDSYNADLCIKCVRTEALKSIRDLPATKSLRIEPLFLVLTPSIPSK
jgi:hypothetical protein